MQIYYFFLIYANNYAFFAKNNFYCPNICVCRKKSVTLQRISVRPIEMKQTIPIIALIISMVIWSVSGIAIKHALIVLPPFTMIVMRFVPAVLLMLIIGVICRHHSLFCLQKMDLGDVLVRCAQQSDDSGDAAVHQSVAQSYFCGCFVRRTGDEI